MKKNIWIHVGIIVALFAVACIYLSPALSGKVIRQGDIQKADAMSYQQRMEKERTGKTPNWAESMFGGMPGYQIASEPQHSVFQPVRNALIMRPLGLERNIGVLFLYLLGFYAALLAFGVSPWLAVVGALGFGLGSYNLIIIEAGHITKAWAMALMAPVLAGMYLLLKGEKKQQWLWGALLFTLALIIQISCNHIQITFYTAIGCLMMGVAYLVNALVKKQMPSFLAKVGVLVVGAMLAFGCNARLLLVNEEYARYTMRGGNDLTVTPSSLYGDAEAAPQNTSDGLDIDYAFNWSYGIGETYTVLVPGAFGGGSGEHVGTESAFYKTFRSEQAPLYWGGQPFTSGPVYFGAIMVLLFIVGLIVVRGPDRWWLAAATLLAILLSWGHNLMGFNGWIFEHVPFYNKFRTPSMALVLANVCMVIMAALVMKQVFNKENTAADRRRINLGLYIGTGLVAGLILVVLVLSSGFDFSGAADRQMAEQYGPQWDMIKSVLVSDRAALLRSDSWRSILFVLLAAAMLWLYNNQKIKRAGIAIAVLGVLTVVDLWGVGRRYLNEDNFAEKRELELRRDAWDYDIDQQAAYFGDHHYRVFNLAVNTFNDSKPSAFHNQVGGYSAAKLSRYQNLIDFYLSRHINPQVLNMLNTRYIVQMQGNQPVVMRNPDALGNCWFVGEVKRVASADEEILALNSINPATTAVVNTEQWPLADGDWSLDSSATIALEPQQVESADYRKYVSHSSKEQLAVFSEIHYAPDWRAYIDGQPADYLCADYVLRAMVVPAGDHVIEFRNEAPRLHRLDNLTLTISIVTLLLMAGAIVMVYRKRKGAN